MADDIANLLEGKHQQGLPNGTYGNYKNKKRDGTSLFQCPYCGGDHTCVSATYRIGQGPDFHKHGFLGVTRRRTCLICNITFTTHEKVPTREGLLVIKRDGAREPFDRDKLTKSFKAALADRVVSRERLFRIVLAIEAALQPKQKNGAQNMKTRFCTVTSHEIGALVLNSLRELDEVAYIRYASIFLRFKSRDYFEQLLTTMSAPPVELT